MEEESTISLQHPLDMPAATSSSPGPDGGMNGGENETLASASAASTPSSTNTTPTTDIRPAESFPSKTDKPKPHGCSLCGRHFARLEHLKRHERSHTKEKPFQCPECSRAFSRQDLLQRHKQKLHPETTPPAKPRKRKSISGNGSAGLAGPNRVRKSFSGSMRPRANTLSHVEGVSMQLSMLQSPATPQTPGNQNHIIHTNHGHSRHPSLAELPMNRNYEFGGMSGINGMSTAMDHRGVNHGLPRLETADLNRMDYSGGLRTAPVPGAFPNPEFEYDSFRDFVFPPPTNGSTINPNALHYKDSPESMAIDSTDPFASDFQDTSSVAMLDDNFTWQMSSAFNQMNFDAANENAIDGSSPSVMSSTSYSGGSDGVMLDGSNNTAANSAMWHQHAMANPLMTHNFMDNGNQQMANNFVNGNSISPHDLSQNHANTPYFPTPSPLGHSVMPGLHNGLNTTQGLHSPMTLGSEIPSSMPGGVYGSLPLSTITDSTRSALMNALAQDTSYGGRKFSIPSANTQTPMSPRFQTRSNSVSESINSLPSTADLQRFIGAYIDYFHPHLPFLHISTLSFDLRSYDSSGRGANTSIDGHLCLALSMAAIGALYEKDHLQAKAVFELAKKMLHLYIEERRKADVRRADHRKTSTDHNSRVPQIPVSTPVWLAQAMLLNIIYGLNCGDKVAGDNSIIHCATLVSLAKAAELMRQPPSDNRPSQKDAHMTNGTDMLSGDIKIENSDDQQEWLNWKVAEERKRTLYAIFILSSMLVSAYNQSPALTNSEIESDLPCDEEFWSADSAHAFYAMGGAMNAERRNLTFKAALGDLLQASSNQQAQAQSFGNGHNAQDLVNNALEPSTFGGLILIHALHNYIWETRQRHTNKAWTNEDTEKMHHHIEPALRAWQQAWQRNPKHHVKRPNPNGTGPLSADSVPLLDLAYIRLYVNMSKSKEKLWQRDFDGMANELCRGSELAQNAEQSPSLNADSMEFSSGSNAGSVFIDSPASGNTPLDIQPFRNFHHSQVSSTPSLKRERYLRKAANYAADSLTMTDKLGITFADFTSRELPLQSAMCAFDCAQVLAEWVTTVQERIGRYLGILGKDEINTSQVPALMYLEEEDIELLHKIQDVLNSSERRMHLEQTTAMSMSASQGLPALDSCGYGSKILRVTAYLIDKAGVWQVTRLMAHALETQAIHMQTRAENSLIQR